MKWTSLTALAAALVAPAAMAETPSPLRAERWSEDWTHESDNPLKNIEIAPDVHLNIGFDARWKVETLDAPRLGLAGETEDSWLSQRLWAHADAHFGDDVRVFVQLGAHDVMGRRTKSSADDDRIDLNEAFIDFNRDFGATHAMLRLGRQELFLGSPRFVTLRDNGNLRQRHELARLSLTRGNWRADAFSGRPMRDKPGAFDDRADPMQEFFGLRLGRQFENGSIDALYYDLSRDSFAMAGVTANERRRSAGARATARFGDYDFDGEFLVQSGHFGAQDVRAFGGGAELGRRFSNAPWSPRLGGRVTYGSGDSNPADVVQETFAPPFPRSAWFGQNGLATFSNNVEAAATLGLAPAENVSLDLKLAGIWRADSHDFAYAGTNSALPGTRGGDAAMGITSSLAMTWRPSANVTISGYASTVQVSRHMRDIGASDVHFAQMAVAFRY